MTQSCGQQDLELNDSGGEFEKKDRFISCCDRKDSLCLWNGKTWQELQKKLEREDDKYVGGY